MNRTVGIYAGLLVLLMGASYLSWTHEGHGKEETGIVLMDVEAKDLTSIAFKSDDFSLKLEAKTDKLGAYIWAESDRLVKAPKSKDGTPAGEDTRRTMSFKASAQAESVFEQFAPFRAARQLEVSTEDLEAFGLKEAQATLTLETSKGTREFEIGKEGYGHRQYYLRDQQSKAVYLVDGQSIRSIRRGDNRLPERRLTEIEIGDLASVTVKSGEVNATFEQHNASDRGKAFWSKPGETEKNISAESWMEKLMRMRAIGYADKSLNTAEIEVAAAIELKTESGVVLVEILRGQNPAGAETWFGRSEFTRGLVKLPPALAGTMIPDVVTLIGLEPPPKAPIKPPASAPLPPSKLPLGIPAPKPKTGDAQAKPNQADPAKADPAKADPAKADPTQTGKPAEPK